MFKMIEAAGDKFESNTNRSKATGDCESCGPVIYDRMFITMGIQDEVCNESIKSFDFPRGRTAPYSERYRSRLRDD